MKKATKAFIDKVATGVKDNKWVVAAIFAGLASIGAIAADKAGPLADAAYAVITILSIVF
ncbi:hypothetical protein M2341_000986 [Sphingobium sp. B7D2B]|uniref:hypothetical protein n=1 Tax=Sphingobium sp. B7D2B TaxID=2940583 RepID=UPI0022255D28|nr:hypothetical protein [Sphingobium sp. B7D2B]MCW2365539.1 hypothetical protein [Sphingobium sp. B7D2B]